MTDSDRRAEPFAILVVHVDGRPEMASSALAATVASVEAQTVSDWELVIVDAASEVTAEVAADEPRTRFVDGPDALARALEESHAAWCGVIRVGDTLHPMALKTIADDLAGAGDDAVGIDVVYTDEDGPSADSSDGTREPRYKPAWSPERLRHGNLLDGLCLLRTSTVREVGSWNPAAGEAASYDLILRVTERGGAVLHVPEILYHAVAAPEPTAKSDEAARDAARAHLLRIGSSASVEAGPVPGAHRIVRTLEPGVSVSIVIPTAWKSTEIRGRQRCLVLEAVRTMLALTAHKAVQVIVVYDEPVPDGALETLQELAGDALLAIPYRSPFNFSEKCNLGFLHATGDVVVLANDDLEPISQNWLESLVAPALEADVGLVGAKLLFEDGTIQHGGHLHLRDPKSVRPVLAYRGKPGDTVGEAHSLVVNREVSGVTGACVAIRRDVYERVGGLTEDLPANFNDVDLSLKVTLLGLRILWLADPVLYHFESKSRVAVVEDFETHFLRDRWGGVVGDPYLPWLMPPVPRPRPVSDEPRAVPRQQ